MVTVQIASASLFWQLQDKRQALCRAECILYPLLPAGKSIFFNVVTAVDPFNLLTPNAVLGVNRKGIHLFKEVTRPQAAPSVQAANNLISVMCPIASCSWYRPVNWSMFQLHQCGQMLLPQEPYSLAFSANLADIMHYGSSKRAMFFKVKRRGELHILRFDTTQGDTICSSLQQHINHAFMRRFEVLLPLFSHPLQMQACILNAAHRASCSSGIASSCPANAAVSAET